VPRRRAGADRPAQRAHRRARVRAGALPAGLAVEHLLPHRRHDLDPGRVRHGAPVGRDQGHPERHRRGGAARRRERLADVPPHHRAERAAHARRRPHHDHHRDAEDLRHPADDDRRALRHPGAGQPHVRPVLHLRQQRGRLGARRGDLRPRRPDRRVQRAADGPQPGGARSMSVMPANPAVAEPRTGRSLPDPRRTVRRPAASRAKAMLGTRIGSAAAVLIAVLWTVPTAGLFISSIRPAAQIRTTGWWTFLTSPSFTLENYPELLFGLASSGALAGFFLNTVVLTVPATLIPLPFATQAAYAFSVLRRRGRDTLFVVVFALQTVPLQMSLIPLLRLFAGTGAAEVFPYLAVWV